MRIVIAAVGRLRRGPEFDLVETYRRRMHWPVSIREVEERRPLAAAERQRREAELLRAAVPDAAARVALDEHGIQMDSRQFADRIGAWQEGGRRDLAFVIGGADGLDAAFLAEINLKVSLGTMTWPHLLVRGMLMEQLYRAQQILAGHPYHKG
ncbi:MAG: 23S rRNA (pseudouridine(1915)-N(3))-methyltransferase RlmH [Alphaproteobacteria bacterium]|nr:23S rRNA (pseudouridine(1915)-N(3))-methyltransferase RlmH [Alphaproteobacteria bacterium]